MQDACKALKRGAINTGIIRKGFAFCSLLMLLVGLSIKTTSAQYADQETFDQQALKSKLIRELYLASTLPTVIGQLEAIVKQDLLALSKVRIKKSINKVELSANELALIEQVFLARLSELRLSDVMIEQFAQRFSLTELKRLKPLIDNEWVQSVVAGQFELNVSESEQQNFKDYQCRLISEPPLKSRVDLMRALTEAQGGAQLDVHLRSEIRRALLKEVYRIMYGDGDEHESHLQKAPTALLTKILSGYQRSLSNELNQYWLHRNLYLFRFAKSEHIQVYIRNLQALEYRDWLTVSTEVVTAFVGEYPLVSATAGGVVGRQ